MIFSQCSAGAHFNRFRRSSVHKLNYLCHDHLLLYEPLWRGWDAIQLSGSNGPTKPIRIDNVRTRTIGACARVLCKWRMISST